MRTRSDQQAGLRELSRVARERMLSVLEDGQVITVPIPHDCADGFLGAYWRRPEAYLNVEIRSGISSFATCLRFSAWRSISPLGNGKVDTAHSLTKRNWTSGIGWSWAVQQMAAPSL